MDMDKIKKYNQILLAIAGTLGLLLLLGAGIIGLYETWSYSRDYDEGAYDTSILSEEVTDSLVTDHQVRRQIITLSNFNLLDSAASIYILPVRQKNLGEDEGVDDALLGLMNRSSGGYGSGKNNDSRRSYRGINYNNLILFGPHLSNPMMLFDEKVSIDNYYLFNYKDTDYLLIRAAESDTNKDGVLNGYDIRKLWLYDLAKKVFIPLKPKGNTSFINFAENVASEELILQYGEDRNGNGEFEERYEPKSYYKLDIETGEMELVVPLDMLEELQGILEGSMEGEE